MTTWRVCHGCGQEFLGRGHAKTCSGACRTKLYRIRLRHSQPKGIKPKKPKKKKDPIRWSGPVLAGDRLVLASSNGQVVTISPYSGELLGKLELPDGVFLPPIVAADTIFFLTEDAQLIAYR